MSEVVGRLKNLSTSEKVRALLESVHLEELCDDIVKEIKDLEKSAEFLQALESWGVDNWSGYSEAYRECHPNEDDDFDFE